MPNNRIPLAVPDLRGSEASWLQRCVAGGWVSSAGPYVTEFENAIASLAGVAQGVAIVNGKAALQVTLVAAGVRKDAHVSFDMAGFDIFKPDVCDDAVVESGYRRLLQSLT